MMTIRKKSFGAPDETAQPGEKMTMETVEAAGVKIYKVTVQPGWQWSKHLKPVVKTETCQRHHLLYLLSGSLTTRMDDGTEMTLAPGEIGDIPPGHDGWVAGDEPAVWLELPH